MNVNRNVGVPSNIDQFFIPLLTRNLQIMWSSEGSGILIFIFRLMKNSSKSSEVAGICFVRKTMACNGLRACGCAVRVR